MFGLGECGRVLSVNLDGDISNELAMLRGIEYARKYAEDNAKNITKVLKSFQPHIKKVIFNDPATIVLWDDGTKTVVKAQNEPFDPEKGLAMAIAKKYLGNKAHYYYMFKRWLPKGENNEKD